MKHLILSILILFLVSCSKEKNPPQQPEEILVFEATDEVLVGSGNYGDLTGTASKIVTFSIKNNGTTNLIGPAMLEDATNYSIIYQNNCTTVLPTKTCTVKVNFSASGKTAGTYTTKLNLDRVFVSLTANVVTPAPLGIVEFRNGTTVITSQNFGNISDLQSVQKTITIKNVDNQTINYTASLSDADYGIIFDSCSGKNILVGTTCSIKISLQGSGKSGLIESNLLFGTGNLPLSGTVNSTAIAHVEYFVNTLKIEELDYGDVNPGQNILKAIVVKNTGLIPINFPLTISGSGYNIIYDMCSNKPIAPLSTCLIKVNYAVPNVVGVNLGAVEYNSVVLNLKSKIVSPPPVIPPKIKLANYNPNTSIVDFGNVEQDSGLTATKIMTIKNDSGATQSFSIQPTLTNYTIESNTCLNATLLRNTYCTIGFKFKSDGKQIQNYNELFLMENATHKIEFNLKANVIANSGVVVCNMTNASAGGGVNNSNGAVVAVEGDFPLCVVKTCQQYYSISPDQKSCIADTRSCIDSDVIALGGASINAATYSGNVIAGDISPCKIETCSVNYEPNATGLNCIGTVVSCSAPDITALGGSNINAVAYSGTVVAGDRSSCKIATCSANYSPNATGLNCTAVERNCTGPDVVSIGGVTTNALTYSGTVIGGDANSCKIATCSNPYEPSTTGLLCENKTMTNLSFTITNKNVNGYIKDSYAQLSIVTLNALEMKLSDATNCSTGSWEAFNSSKQFVIPAGRLNSTDAPISIQFRRNATTSACIFVSGGIAVATSHMYRHDNIAPIPLTLTSYTNNQDVSVASLTFSGSCMSGLNRDTGLFGQALTSAACAGTYTSQSISTVSDGIYPLYVKQTDLAGNLAEVKINVRRITACNSGNATSGGVRSVSGALGFAGNLTDGCTITSCNASTNLAGDLKSCDDKDIVGGLFNITKNPNGYINTGSVFLTSISATNANTFDIFENSSCASSPVVLNRAMVASTSYTPTTLNHSSDQAVSLLFKNGTKTKCVHVAGAISVTTANTYRHDNIAPSPLTITSTLVANGGTITDSAITSITFSGTCDSSVGSLTVGTYNSETATTCSGNAYNNKVISGTFASDNTYYFTAKQTDLAGNISQPFYTVIRDTKKNLTVSKTGLGSGSVSDNLSQINSCSGTCIGRYAPGTSVVLTALPNSDSTFTTWGAVTGAQSSGCGTSTTCTIVIGTGNVSVSPSFAVKPSFNVTVTMAGLGFGTATDGQGFSCSTGNCIKSVYSGDSLTLTATPNVNSTFAGWSGTGGCSGTGTCVLSNITAAKAVTATFNLRTTYTISVNKTGTFGTSTVTGGTISCGSTCSQVVYSGDSLTLTANPDANTIFTGWGGGCTGTGTCVLSNISAAATISAGFRVKNNYTFSLTKTGSASINLTSSLANNCNSIFPCSFTVQEGSNITLSAIYSGDNGFTGWGGDCSGSQNTCSFTNVVANKNISLATFIIPPSIADTNRLAFKSSNTGMAVYNDSNSPVYVEQSGQPLFEQAGIYKWSNRLVVNSNKIFMFKNNIMYTMNASYGGITVIDTSAVTGLTIGSYMFSWLGQTTSYAYFFATNGTLTGNLYSIDKSTNAVALVSNSLTNSKNSSYLSVGKVFGDTVYFVLDGKLLAVNNSRTVTLVHTSLSSDGYSYFGSMAVVNGALYLKDNGASPSSTIYKITAPGSKTVVTSTASWTDDFVVFGNYIGYLAADATTGSKIIAYNTSGGSISTAYNTGFTNDNVMYLDCFTFKSKFHCKITRGGGASHQSTDFFAFTSFPSTAITTIDLGANGLNYGVAGINNDYFLYNVAGGSPSAKIVYNSTYTQSAQPSNVNGGRVFSKGSNSYMFSSGSYLYRLNISNNQLELLNTFSPELNTGFFLENP